MLAVAIARARARAAAPRGRSEIAMLVLTVVGLLIAAYLTYVHYRGITVLCVAHGGCEQVQSSRWSKLAGVPVAAIGLGGYALILATLFVRTEVGRLATVLATLVGFGFSGYLTYRELFSIDAICQWCVASATILTILAVLAVVRFLCAEPQLPEPPG